MSASERARKQVIGFVVRLGLVLVWIAHVPVIAWAANQRAGLADEEAARTSLPAAVMHTVRANAHGREVVAIDRERWEGRIVYEVELKDRGINPRLYIAEDGTLLRDPRQPRGLGSSFLGLQIEDTPAAVQQAVKRIAGHREIVDIDQEGAADRPVYRVEMRGPSGTQEIRLDREGRIVRDVPAAVVAPRR